MAQSSRTLDRVEPVTPETQKTMSSNIEVTSDAAIKLSSSLDSANDKCPTSLIPAFSMQTFPHFSFLIAIVPDMLASASSITRVFTVAVLNTELTDTVATE